MMRKLGLVVGGLGLSVMALAEPGPADLDMSAHINTLTGTIRDNILANGGAIIGLVGLMAIVGLIVGFMRRFTGA